jgi:putative membrane protein
MRILSWIFYIALFILALGFALSNTEPVELRLFSGYATAWRAPLVVFLLAFLGLGAVLGLLAAVPALFRARREIAHLRKELRQANKRVAVSNEAQSAEQMPAVPPPPASASTPLGV